MRDEGPPDMVVGMLKGLCVIMFRHLAIFVRFASSAHFVFFSAISTSTPANLFNNKQTTTTIECGKVIHECESELVCKLTHTESKVPYFNAGIYLENKKKIGKVDEIFGPINLVMFTIKMDPGVVAKSFQEEDMVYISVDKLLPLTRFTNREWMLSKMCVMIVLALSRVFFLK